MSLAPTPVAAVRRWRALTGAERASGVGCGVRPGALPGLLGESEDRLAVHWQVLVGLG